MVMSVNWEKRASGDDAPEYSKNYFSVNPNTKVVDFVIVYTVMMISDLGAL